MKVYITKYALTQGIIGHEAGETSDTMIAVTDAKYQTYYHKPDWHLSWSDAVAQANKMRAKKIASLKRQLAKLEALTFE